MSAVLILYTENAELDQKLKAELKNKLPKPNPEIQIRLASEVAVNAENHIHLVYGSSDFVDPLLEKINAEKSPDHKKSVRLLVVDTDTDAHFNPNSSILPPQLTAGKVDGLIGRPFRTLDLLDKIQTTAQIIAARDGAQLNQSLAEILRGLETDLQAVTRLHKAKLPKRFPDIKGYQIVSRYLAGSRSGGDYFDVGESKDKANIPYRLTVVFSNSSSYHLSGEFSAALVKAAITPDLAQFGQQISEQLLPVMKEKDELALFYGYILNKTQEFKFFNLGDTAVFLAPPARSFHEISPQGLSIAKNRPFHFQTAVHGEVEFPLGSRFAIVSRGFIDGLGGLPVVLKILNEFREREAIDALNEFAFRVKSDLTEDEMPARDCTVIIFDAHAKVHKLSTVL